MASEMKYKAHLSRDLGLFSVTMIGVGAMIGAGIFVLTGIAAGAAGPALVLAFFLNGLVTLLTAMVYAELGSCFPDAGGGYLWVKEGLPQPMGFLSGWMSWFAHAVACSLYALGFGAYFGHVLQELGLNVFGLHPEILIKVLAVTIIAVFTYINFRGASETGVAGNVVTALKIVVIGLFILFGLKRMLGQPESVQSTTSRHSCQRDFPVSSSRWASRLSHLRDMRSSPSAPRKWWTTGVTSHAPSFCRLSLLSPFTYWWP